MKDSLIEIKNNLQGNNNRVDEAKNQINDLKYKEVKKKKIHSITNSEGKEPRVQINNLEHKEEINNQPEQNFKKFKKMRIV